MKTKHRIIQWLALLALATLNSQLSTALAQGTTAFTYQGQLRDGGTNANGAYTMIFKLYDAVTSGNQIGSAITNSPTLGNGLFTVNLNFGAGAFNGSARWLDITISNGGVTQTLSPRVQVLPAPYAQFAAVAATVTNGAITTAQLAANSVTTANLANGAVTNRSLTANAVNATNIASGQVVKSLNGLTDYVILSAGTNVSLLTNGNTLKISAGVPSFSAGVPSFQIFTSSGTFVVPSNVTKIMVELWGGGGGGGSGYPFSDSDGTGDWTGGGGGAGGYGWNVFNVIPGNSYTVTTPADADGGVHGGTTSFGSLMSATGGSPGANATRSSTGSGGAGGISTGGVINFTSGSGFDGWRGGLGGGVWRGGGGSVEGPGSGGNGGNGNPGEGAGSGIVIVYY
jgi:flagella basal body P-ring formation protein FlgA